MKIETNYTDNELTVALEGRLDTTTAPELETTLKPFFTEELKSIVFDFEKLEYISSAGLRVLLTAQKIMNKQGKMVVRNAGEDILSVFEITGFSDILTIE